jgi:hypothetical protein
MIGKASGQTVLKVNIERTDPEYTDTKRIDDNFTDRVLKSKLCLAYTIMRASLQLS